ncbi:MAG: DUF1295 domain-containing protein [Candidatus Izimaplasma sp.]|nr:DUF1295 domain-containing protein [Candidatus Izimaplasma bacterium]
MELFPLHSFQLSNLFWFPLIYGIISLLIMGNITKDSKKRILTFPNYKSSVSKFFSIFFMIVFGKLIIVYSIFVPIKANTLYFYIGILIYSIGIFCSVYAMWTFSKADLSRPVTTGMYKYTRHPMQVMYYFSWIGLGFIGGSWIIIVYALIFPILTLPSLIAQEEDCMKKYGADYIEYLKKTPRFLFFK